MQIKRDYSQPFFGPRRHKRNPMRTLFFFALLIGGLLLFVTTQFGSLQMMAYELIGAAPTPTLLPSELATEANALYMNGNAPAAAALYQRAVEQRPEDINYLYEYGQVLIDVDQPEEALQLAEQIIALDARDVRGFSSKRKHSSGWMIQEQRYRLRLMG